MASRDRQRSLQRVTLMIADEATFRLLSESYASFVWSPDQHEEYLDSHDGAVEKSRRAGGLLHLGRFDHDDYLDFCEADGLPPDSGASRSAYAVWCSETGMAKEWEGSVRDLLVSASLLDAVGSDVDAAVSAAGKVVDELTDLMLTAPPGSGSVTVTVSAPGDEVTTVVFPWEQARTELRVNRPFDVLFAAVTAGVANGGGLIVRLPTGVVLDGAVPQTRVLGWRLGHHDATEIPEAELFNAFCTDATTGDLLPPEFGTVYGRA
ncbi:hypothetical protein [Actinoplanes couchii]|uniref:Uncharacterized protein n=1 Tax=Actinoplanes couchii TaxID=403638 RepID=A0ABQ3XNN1_9ACTN|nr:hypothetical protein [Actinoplanes couchii]MDR6318046.1 hypothetical protein [Actinoplanes couchii]GID60037.1 hypothetical protein Aco03nite_084410 [Actinoplanes couchii]